MTIQRVLRKKRTGLIGIPILLIAVFFGGPYIYIHFIEGDPPAKLALSKVKTQQDRDRGIDVARRHVER